MSDFLKTKNGVKLLEHDIPVILDTLKRIAIAIEHQNLLIEKNLNAQRFNSETS